MGSPVGGPLRLKAVNPVGYANREVAGAMRDEWLKTVGRFLAWGVTSKKAVTGKRWVDDCWGGGRGMDGCRFSK